MRARNKSRPSDKPRSRTGAARHRTGWVTRGELDAHLRRFDERAELMFARIDERFARTDERFARIDERSAEADRRLAEYVAQSRAEQREARERLEAKIAEGDQREKEERQRVAAQIRQSRKELLEARKEWKALKWNIWTAACATAIALASLNASMMSNLFEAMAWGRDMALATAEANRATAGASPPPAALRRAPSKPLPLHGREDAGHTLEDNQPQS